MAITYPPFGCNCVPAYNLGADNFIVQPECIPWRSANCGLAGFPWEYGSRQLTQQEQVQQGSFSGCNFPQAAEPSVIRGWSFERGCYTECPPNLDLRTRYNGVLFCAKQLTDKWDPGKFFTEIGITVAQSAARIAAAYATGGTSIALEAAQTFAQVQGAEMGLDLGGIIGGAIQGIGGLASGNYLGALQGVGSIATSFMPQPTAQIGFAPSYSMPQYGIQPYGSPQPPVYQTQNPVIAASASAIMRIVAPILAKVAAKLGLKRLSLTKAIGIIRKMAQWMKDPAVIAIALGITSAELASLIVGHNARKRRHMNPANSRALRRAVRRIKSFHRLCTHTDVIRKRGSRYSRMASPRCVTCRKSPCRC